MKRPLRLCGPIATLLVVATALCAGGCGPSPVPDDAGDRAPGVRATASYDAVSLDALPAAVADTRRRLLRAARARDWTEIDAVAAENAAFPHHLDDEGMPPTVAWRSYGEEYAEAMAESIARVLSGEPRRYRAGMSPNASLVSTSQPVYLWPAWAHTPADSLSPLEKAAVEATRPGLLREMEQDDAGLYRDSRLEISEDGTWLYFGVAT